MMLQVLVLAFLLFLIPAMAGKLFVTKYEGRGKGLFSWVSGQMLLWAGFLFLGIPLILLEKPFHLLVTFFGIYVAAMVLLGLFVRIKNKGSRQKDTECMTDRTVSGYEKLLWVLFIFLLLLQLVLTVFLAYEEGDDAFYVAISVLTEKSDTMYQILPYTGATTGLDARHGLAPFPVWIAWLARMSGMEAVTVAQVALPVVLVLMAYAVYYLIGALLFARKPKNIPFFMVLTELLVLFGGYSVYSAENFLLVRASQGKAVLANVILPFLLVLFMQLLEKLQENSKCSRGFWILLALTMASGCLCSTQGTILTCLILGVTGLCTAVGYKRWKILFPMMLCAAVPVGMALLYFMYR